MGLTTFIYGINKFICEINNSLRLFLTFEFSLELFWYFLNPSRVKMNFLKNFLGSEKKERKNQIGLIYSRLDIMIMYVDILKDNLSLCCPNPNIISFWLSVVVVDAFIYLFIIRVSICVSARSITFSFTHSKAWCWPFLLIRWWGVEIHKHAGKDDVNVFFSYVTI